MSAAHPTASRPPPSGLRDHLRRTFELALPVMFARTGILLLVVVDTAMIGRHDTRELAAYALSTAPQMPMLLFGIGALMGTMVMSAQAVGAGEFARTGQVWRVSMGFAAVLGLALGVACQFGEPLLLAAGQDPALSAGAGRVLAIFGYGMPAMLMFAATSFFLESVDRPAAGMVVMLLANLLNVVGNWLLIGGNAGLPALGAEGAALATTVVRWLMVAGVAGYALLRLPREHYGLRGPVDAPRLLAERLFRLGLPMGLAHAMESAAFACLTVFAGWVGVHHVAAFQICMNLLATLFMCAIGLATAASIRVANAIGRGDAMGVRHAGWTAAALAASLLSTFALVVALLPREFAALYTQDPVVLALTIPTLLLGAVAIIPDGLQGVLMGALRGTGDVWPATGLYLISFWCVMVPSGYYLGVVSGHGAPALIGSVALGALVATVLFSLRFQRVSRTAVPV